MQVESFLFMTSSLIISYGPTQLFGISKEVRKLFLTLYWNKLRVAWFLLFEILIEMVSFSLRLKIQSILQQAKQRWYKGTVHFILS